MYGIRRVCVAAAAMLTLPAVASSQERTLTTPEARFDTPFDMIAGVRELADGRVLVSDGIAEALVAVDLAAGTAAPIGRAGRGPREYKLPDALFPLPGDRTLLLDLGNGRLTTIEPDGRIGESKSMASDGPGGFSIIMPRATDGQGRLYHQPMGNPRGGAMPDSGAVVRVDRATGQADTVAMVKLPAVKVDASGGPNERSVMTRPIPYAPQDAWGVAADGSVAVARAGDEYRLDWYRPGGRIVRGPAVPVRPVPIRDTEKEEWIEAQSNGLSVMVTNENGRRNVQFGRGGGPRRPDPDAFEWPDAKPAFPAAAVTVTPDGDAWVRRSVPAGAPARYDVFGPDGTREEQVVFPTGRRVVAFGKGSVYAAQTDADGLQWLERYRR